MISLFIDTSTSTLSIGLFKDDILVYSKVITSSEHSKYTMPAIEEAFTKNNIDPMSVNKILVTNGPGSFTGIRIGVTIAKTYAWACNINVIPISTLKAYALSYEGYNYYVPLIDARRNYAYAAIYDKKYNNILEDTYISMDELKDKLKNLDNILVIGKEISNYDIKDPILNIQKIYDYYKDEEGINPHALLPNYLKKTEAEEKFGDIND